MCESEKIRDQNTCLKQEDKNKILISRFRCYCYSWQQFLNQCLVNSCHSNFKSTGRWSRCTTWERQLTENYEHYRLLTSAQRSAVYLHTRVLPHSMHSGCQITATRHWRSAFKLFWRCTALHNVTACFTTYIPKYGSEYSSPKYHRVLSSCKMTKIQFFLPIWELLKKYIFYISHRENVKDLKENITNAGPTADTS